MADYRQADIDEARKLVPGASTKAQERVARALAARYEQALRDMEGVAQRGNGWGPSIRDAAARLRGSRAGTTEVQRG